MNIYVHIRKKNEHEIQYFALDDGNNELFVNTFLNEQSGIVEFLGCVHALMYLKKNNLYGDIYVYNEYIKKCVEEKRYIHNAKSEKGIKSLYRAKMWLSDFRQTIIIYINK